MPDTTIACVLFETLIKPTPDFYLPSRTQQLDMFACQPPGTSHKEPQTDDKHPQDTLHNPRRSTTELPINPRGHLHHISLIESSKISPRYRTKADSSPLYQRVLCTALWYCWKVYRFIHFRICKSWLSLVRFLLEKLNFVRGCVMRDLLVGRLEHGGRTLGVLALVLDQGL